MTITHRLPSLHLLFAAVAMLVLHSCSPEPACAATPLQLRWTAELSEPKPYQAVLFAGESADLQATLKLYGRAVALEDTATASLYWQTNGMGSAWWQSPATVTTAGVVTASWTPSMDAGADLYRWHIGVANAASSTIYRAFGAFRMQPSPGAAPNILDLPVRWIDFDLVAISNAPWATPADVAAATEGMLVEESDPVALPVSSNALLIAQAALPKTGGTVDGFLTAVAYQTISDEESGRSSAVFPTHIVAAHDISTGRGGASFWSWGMNGFNTDGVSWRAFWPTNRVDSPIATIADVQAILPDVSIYATTGELAAVEADIPDTSGLATSNWVESIRGVHADIASNVVYHVVVSNGHWLIQEVE